MLYEQTYGIISGHQLHGSCDCFDNVATHYIPGMGTPGNITTQIPSTRSNIGILYLPKPERSFHGNHWFHIGEHYISRRKIVQELLAVQVQRGGSIQHLKVVVEDPKLANMMTKMSFSLIVLTCLVAVEDQKLTRLLSIELFRESDVALRTADNSNRRTSVNSLSASQRAKIVMKTDPLFGYYKQDGANGVFEDYLSGGRHSSAGASVLKVSGSENTGFVQHWQHDQQFQHKHKRKCQRTASVTVAVENLYRHFTPPLQSSQEVTTTAGTRGTASVATQAGCEERPCSCGVYIGAVAHSPIPSFEWFHSSGEADALRSTALSMCGIPETTLLANSDTSRKLTLLIYQRDLNRRFMHLEAIRTALKERKSSFGASTGNAKRQWDVQIFTHNENAAPCDIYKTLHSADVLLTAHGFQSTGEFCLS